MSTRKNSTVEKKYSRWAPKFSRMTLFRSFMRPHCCLWLLALAMVSCEGNTRHEVRVRHATKNVIRVEHQSRNLSDEYSAIVITNVGPGETVLLASEDWLGGRSEAAEPSQILDSMAVFNASNEQSNHAWRVADQWYIESHQDRKIPSQWRHAYLLGVREGNF